MGHNRFGAWHLCELLQPPLYLGRQIRSVRPNGGHLSALSGLLPRLAMAPSNAAAARLLAGELLHLDRREYRDLHSDLALPRSRGGVAYGVPAKTGQLVPLNDRVLGSGHLGSPTTIRG